MGLREIVLLLIVVVATYVAYQVFRIVRGRGAGKASVPAAAAATLPRAEPPADAADVDEDEDDEVLVFERPVVRRTDDEARPSDSRLFELELELRQLRREFEQQREQQRADAAALRQIVDELGETVRAQKTPTASPLMRQGGSPEYDEALVYARRGLDVDAIAERCGITVAEAELVRSLARGRGGEQGAEQ